MLGLLLSKGRKEVISGELQFKVIKVFDILFAIAFASALAVGVFIIIIFFFFFTITSAPSEILLQNCLKWMDAMARPLVATDMGIGGWRFFPVNE